MNMIGKLPYESSYDYAIEEEPWMAVKARMTVSIDRDLLARIREAAGPMVPISRLVESILAKEFRRAEQ